MGLIRAVVFDWAGTTVDLGSLAPVRAIQRTFAQYGIVVSEGDARRDMGLPKREHLKRILTVVEPRAGERELSDYYATFVTAQLEVLAESSTVIPGVVEAVHALRSRGIRIGSTTGYSRAMLDVVIAKAREQGYTPDCSVTPEEAGGGRPHPYMMYAAAVKLERYPLGAIVKVGDTPADIEEGRNAGSWTIGVSETGNSDKLTLERAGAHFVTDSAGSILPILDEIECRLAARVSP